MDKAKEMHFYSDIHEINPGLNSHMKDPFEDTVHKAQSIKVNGIWFVKIGFFYYALQSNHEIAMIEFIDGKIKTKEMITFDSQNRNITISHEEDKKPGVIQIIYFRKDGSVLKRRATYQEIRKVFDLEGNGDMYTYSSLGAQKVMETYPTTWEECHLIHALVAQAKLKRNYALERKKKKREEAQKQKKRAMGPTLINIQRNGYQSKK